MQIKEVRTVTEAGRFVAISALIVSYAMVEFILDVLALIILGSIRQKCPKE
jgi:hypothetical protein